MTKNKSALVLSGGGALGLAHVGVVKVLEKEHDFEWIAGVSAGAIIGAAVACGMNARQIERALKQTNLMDLAFDFSWKNTGLIAGDSILEILDDIYGGRDFSDLKVPFAVGATDFSSGERLTIREGNVAAAVRASLAIPVLFVPYFHEETQRYLVDGGLTQNFPLDLAIEEYQGSLIFGVNVANVKALPDDFHTDKFLGRNRDLVKNLQRTFRIFFRSQQNFADDERVRLIEPNLDNFSSAAFSHSKHLEIIKTGENSTRSLLENGWLK